MGEGGSGELIRMGCPSMSLGVSDALDGEGGSCGPLGGARDVLGPASMIVSIVLLGPLHQHISSASIGITVLLIEPAFLIEPPKLDPDVGDVALVDSEFFWKLDRRGELVRVPSRDAMTNCFRTAIDPQQMPTYTSTNDHVLIGAASLSGCGECV